MEADYLEAQTTYNLALMKLTLLQDERIVVGITCGHGLPAAVLDKHPAGYEPHSSYRRVP